MVLTSSVHILFYAVVASFDYSQMAPSPLKKKSTAKKADKRLKMDSKLFRSEIGRASCRERVLMSG